MNKTSSDRLCKLTKQPGKFVDSHIIPESLTRPSVKGRPLYQYGERSTPVRRWSSWYDSNLVTEAGERYLTELDTWAIQNLRKHRLVWSGWGTHTTLDGHFTKINDFLGVRQVNGLNPRTLRLFFLSLLWRAAATELPEFSEITIPEDDIEYLRQLIVNGDPGPLTFYPCQLTQLSTKGPMHNHTPVRDIKILTTNSILGPSAVALPTFRFYFDGLIAHMHVSLPKNGGTHDLGNLIVGADNSLALSTVTFEESLQGLNMHGVMRDYGIDSNAPQF